MRKLTTMSGMDPMRSTSSAVKRNLPKHPGANDTICLCLFAFGGGALPRRKQHHFASFSYCFFSSSQNEYKKCQILFVKKREALPFFLLLSRAAAGPLQKQKGIRRRRRRRMRCATLKRLCIRPTEDLTRKGMLSMNHFLSQTVRNSIAFEFLQSRRILN